VNPQTLVPSKLLGFLISCLVSHSSWLASSRTLVNSREISRFIVPNSSYLAQLDSSCPIRLLVSTHTSAPFHLLVITLVVYLEQSLFRHFLFFTFSDFLSPLWIPLLTKNPILKPTFDDGCWFRKIRKILPKVQSPTFRSMYHDQYWSPCKRASTLSSNMQTNSL
jgi:hypothetical protein